MHTQEEAQALIVEYFREKRAERLGQFLMNRMPIPVNDSELFYCRDNDAAASMYMNRYTYASNDTMLAWAQKCDAEGVHGVDLVLAKSKIVKIEFKTIQNTVYCFLVCINGFVCEGKASAFAKKRFNFEIGKRKSFQRAFEALVEHISYQEADILWKDGKIDVLS